MIEEQAVLGRNLAAVQGRIDAACARAGRDPAEVTLVAVSKTVPAEVIRAAYGAGARIFGENYGQHLRDKAEELADLPELRWHFIGPLQRNKVKYAVGRATLLHSVDRPEVLQEISRRAEKAGITQRFCLQVNISGEASKSGVAADEALPLLRACAELPAVRCVGLMTMPPFFDDPEGARPVFAGLRRLAVALRGEALANVELRQLSMGMSGDFEVAIEEGATLVRVGTAIFGPRRYS